MPTPLTPPADFPVQWEQADDVQKHWTRDREHTPHPITHLYQTVNAEFFTAAKARTEHIYEEPIREWQFRRINHYGYNHLVPHTGTPETLAARAARNRAKTNAAALRLGELWETAWQPEILGIFANWDQINTAPASLKTLAHHLPTVLGYAQRLWELHLLFGPPMWFALHEFVTFYCEVFPQQSALEAYQLLQGFDNKTLEMGRALWRLSQLARESALVCRALRTGPWPEVQATLAQSAAGHTFLREWDAFLHTWGERSSLWDWGYPSWRDDPTPVLNNVRNYLAQPDRDLQAEQTRAAAQREQRIATARIALAHYPQPVRAKFEQLLTAAQTALVLTENHTFYLDFNGFGRLHTFFRAIGQHLCATERLSTPDHIFHLKLDEVRAALADPTRDWREVAAARAAELARWAAYPEPRELGLRPDSAPHYYSPDAQRIQKYTGALTPEECAAAPIAPQNTAQNHLHGQPGAAGRVRGPARVILSLTDAHRLQPGDILVTITTAPPWTPLFLTAAGLVTDAGGLLSHGAVVAREYGIPAVVGTLDATTLIQDGQLIEVHGEAGVVKIVG